MRWTWAPSQALGLNRPVRLSQVIAGLNNSLPDFKIFDSGQLGPSTTTGWGQVGFTIDGAVYFRGAVHESGAIGHNYSFVMAIANYRDSAGNVVVFHHEGSVEGTTSGLPFGTPRRDDSWPDDNDPQGNAFIDPFVANNWESIKSSSWEARLGVDTDASAVIPLVIAALVGTGAIGAGTAYVALDLLAAIARRGASCTIQQDPQTGQQNIACPPQKSSH